MNLMRILLPVVVEFDFLESPVRRIVLLEVANVGVDLSVEGRRIEGETDFVAAHRFDG